MEPRGPGVFGNTGSLPIRRRANAGMAEAPRGHGDRVQEVRGSRRCPLCQSVPGCSGPSYCGFEPPQCPQYKCLTLTNALKVSFL